MTVFSRLAASRKFQKRLRNLDLIPDTCRTLLRRRKPSFVTSRSNDICDLVKQAEVFVVNPRQQSLCTLLNIAVISASMSDRLSPDIAASDFTPWVVADLSDNSKVLPLSSDQVRLRRGGTLIRDSSVRFALLYDRHTREFWSVVSAWWSLSM